MMTLVNFDEARIHLMQFSLVISRCNITFSMLWLLQGSVATLIRWGGWTSYLHMWRSFLSLTVKTVLKSVDFWRSYRKKISWFLFHGPRCSYSSVRCQESENVCSYIQVICEFPFGLVYGSANLLCTLYDILAQLRDELKTELLHLNHESRSCKWSLRRSLVCALSNSEVCKHTAVRGCRAVVKLLSTPVSARRSCLSTHLVIKLDVAPRDQQHIMLPTCRRNSVDYTLYSCGTFCVYDHSSMSLLYVSIAG